MRVLLIACCLAVGMIATLAPQPASAQAAFANTPLGFIFQTLDPRSYARQPQQQQPGAFGSRQVVPQRQAVQQRQLPPLGVSQQRQFAPRQYQRPNYRQARFGNYGRLGQQAPAANQNALDPSLRRQLVSVNFSENPGTIIVDTDSRFLYLMMENGQAMRYGVGVGRQGFEWKGSATVGRKAEWPAWVPPKEMREREPWLPARMEGGPENPLGARALYLYQGSKDTLYRIHGTNQPETIGQALSSGCIRMLNDDAIDLYNRVPKGSKVVVI